MIRWVRTQLSAFFVLFIACSAAYADSAYNFVQVSCVKDLNLLSVRTFMLWNVCLTKGQGCSVLPSLKQNGIYDLTDIEQKKVTFPEKCDLGFGKTAEIALTSYHEPQDHGVGGGAEWGIFTITVNGQKMAELSTEDDNDFRLIGWSLDKSPRVDMNWCKSTDRTSIDIPKSMQCSFKESVDDDKYKPFHEKQRDYLPVQEKPADKASTP